METRSTETTTIETTTKATTKATTITAQRPRRMMRATALAATPLLDVWVGGTPIAATRMYRVRRRDAATSPVDLTALTREAATWQRLVRLKLLNWRWFRLHDPRALPRLMSEATRPLTAHLTFHTASGAARSYLPLTLDGLRYALSLAPDDLARVTCSRLALVPHPRHLDPAGVRIQIWEGPRLPMPPADDLSELATLASGRHSVDASALLDTAEADATPSSASRSFLIPSQAPALALALQNAYMEVLACSLG